MQEELFIEDIEFCGFEEQQCISIDNPNGLFIIGEKNEIVTHNSTFTMLALLYVATHFALMRDPWKFFSMSKTSVFVFTLCAVTFSKASEIYREPIQQLIESATFWKYCKSHQEMLKEDRHLHEVDYIDYVPWTMATSSAQPLDSKIYLSNGNYKLMGDLKIGDKIASPTEHETTVIGFPFYNTAPLYEIELDDGRKTRCSIDHLWKVSWRTYQDGTKIWEIVSTKFLIEHSELEFEIFDKPFPV